MISSLPSKIVVCLALLSTFFVAYFPAAQSFKQAKRSVWDDFNDKAQIAIRARDWTIAETMLKSSLRHLAQGNAKQKLRTLFNLALVKFEEKDYEGCEQWIERTTKAEIKFTEHKRSLVPPLELLGDVRTMQGQLQDAKRIYQNALHNLELEVVSSERQKKRLERKVSSKENKSVDASINDYQFEFGAAVQFATDDNEDD